MITRGTPILGNHQQMVISVHTEVAVDPQNWPTKNLTRRWEPASDAGFFTGSEDWMIGTPTRWCPSSLAKLVQISPITMVFVGDISIVNGICLPIYNLGGHHLDRNGLILMSDNKPALWPQKSLLNPISMFKIGTPKATNIVYLSSQPGGPGLEGSAMFKHAPYKPTWLEPPPSSTGLYLIAVLFEVASLLSPDILSSDSWKWGSWFQSSWSTYS